MTPQQQVDAICKFMNWKPRLIDKHSIMVTHGIPLTFDELSTVAGYFMAIPNDLFPSPAVQDQIRMHKNAINNLRFVSPKTHIIYTISNAVNFYTQNK